MSKFPTTIWITPDPDNKHCGECGLYRDRRIEHNYRSDYYCFHPKLGGWLNLDGDKACRTQACIDEEQAWKDKIAAVNDPEYQRRMETE